jgi:DNA-binding MarR family transcriptional regulator
LLVQIARQEYRARRRRAQHIDPSLLGEPVWDILLDLFINAAENRLVSVTSSAIASQVPPTTALRYFAALEAKGLITRQKSQTDARVTFLKLTNLGFRSVGSYLQERAASMFSDLAIQPTAISRVVVAEPPLPLMSRAIANHQD